MICVKTIFIYVMGCLRNLNFKVMDTRLKSLTVRFKQNGMKFRTVWSA